MNNGNNDKERVALEEAVRATNKRITSLKRHNKRDMQNLSAKRRLAEIAGALKRSWEALVRDESLWDEVSNTAVVLEVLKKRWEVTYWYSAKTKKWNTDVVSSRSLAMLLFEFAGVELAIERLGLDSRKDIQRALSVTEWYADNILRKSSMGPNGAAESATIRVIAEMNTEFRNQAAKK